MEDKASGTQLIQDLKSEGMFRIKPYLPPTGSDQDRALVILRPRLFESGKVLLPKRAPWLPEYFTTYKGCGMIVLASVATLKICPMVIPEELVIIPLFNLQTLELFEYSDSIRFSPQTVSPLRKFSPRSYFTHT